ncbi:hypothetical protein AB3U99_21180 [Niallia sp. JL1B1071]|uniref:hypothetical protein n=1 Tax=Niallia tiangongensis TaxID=3237105 RepID=UPI0037DDA3D5
MELVLPKQYVDLEQEEMEYLDGGVDWGKAKSFALGFITAGVAALAKSAVSKSAVGAVMNSAAGWLAGAIDSAILWCWYNPWLAAGIAVAFAGTVAGIYVLGKKKGKWK